MNYTFRPLLAWTDPDTKPRRQRPFQASWSSTMQLLASELEKLDARHVVIQADVDEDDIRLDGMLRANARVGHPGIRIAFDSKYGPLNYATDSCVYWQDNVRSIALGLEALRAVDRYGVTRRGEQYTGWKALPAGSGDAASHMTTDEARALLLGLMKDPEAARHLLPLDQLYRRAQAKAHPDRNDGDRTLWDAVEQAGRVLGIAS